MGHQRRRYVVYRSGKGRARVGRGRSPKHPRRKNSFWGGSVFNLHWLFGRNRFMRRKV